MSTPVIFRFIRDNSLATEMVTMRALVILLVIALSHSAAAAPPDEPLPKGAVARFGSLRMREPRGILKSQLSADARMLALLPNGEDGVGGVPRLWCIETGRAVDCIAFPNTSYSDIQCSPAQNHVALLGTDGVCRAWSMDSGDELLGAGSKNNQELFEIAFDATGRLMGLARDLAALPSSDDKTPVCVVDLWKGVVLARETLGIVNVDSARFAVGGGRAAFMTDHKTLCIVELDQGTRPKAGTRIPFPSGWDSSETSLAVSPTGRVAIATGRPGEIAVVDALRQSTIQSIPIDGTPRVACLSAGAEKVVSITESGDAAPVIRAHETGTGALRFSARAHGPLGRDVAVSGDQRYLAAGAGGEQPLSAVSLWEIKSGIELNAEDGHLGGVIAVSIAADGGQVASLGLDQTLRLWNRADSTSFGVIRAAVPLGGSVEFVDEDRQVVAVGKFGRSTTAARWNSRTAQLLGSLVESRDLFGSALAYSESAGLVAVGMRSRGRILKFLPFDGTDVGGTPTERSVAVFRLTSMQDASPGDFSAAVRCDPPGASKLCKFEESVSAIALSEDGKRLVTISDSALTSEMTIWSIPEGKQLHTFGSLDFRITSLAVTPTLGQIAFVTSSFLPSPPRQVEVDGVFIWDVEGGQHFPTRLEGYHVGTAVEFAPDGKLLAIGRSDGKIDLWNVRDRQTQSSFPGHRGAVLSIDISRTGVWMATGGSDTTVLVWRLPAGTR
jgi:WD40 repeat protein